MSRVAQLRICSQIRSRLRSSLRTEQKFKRQFTVANDYIKHLETVPNEGWLSRDNLTGGDPSCDEYYSPMDDAENSEVHGGRETCPL